MYSFFLDTADIEYLKNKWELIRKYVPENRFLGVTTNPNAMAKENLFSLSDWEKRTKELSEFIQQARGGWVGSVHVQIPSSEFNMLDSFAWARMVKNWGQGKCDIILKVPPYKRFMDMVPKLSSIIDVNVTGCSSAQTALFCATKPIKYVSIIPGRMEEVGIDSSKHLEYLSSARTPDSKWEIIAGSMRTLEGLKQSVIYGTIPTIGKRVLDLINEDNCKEVFSWEKNNKLGNFDSFGPDVTEKSKQLSEEFFKQMNEFGEKCAKDFWNNKK